MAIIGLILFVGAFIMVHNWRNKTEVGQFKKRK